MGRKVVDATNAWRMRRTRGDIGCILLFEAARVAADFLAEALLPAVLPDFGAGVGDFV
jgi:hypothetical protein